MEGVNSTVDGTDNSAASAVAQATYAAREEMAQRHFERLSGLMEAAESLAEAILLGLTASVRQGQPVYAGELIQLCRGLHVLAKCGLELRRQLKVAGHSAPEQSAITAAQIDQLEARLRPLFEQRAA